MPIFGTKGTLTLEPITVSGQFKEGGNVYCWSNII